MLWTFSQVGLFWSILIWIAKGECPFFELTNLGIAFKLSVGIYNVGTIITDTGGQQTSSKKDMHKETWFIRDTYRFEYNWKYRKRHLLLVKLDLLGLTLDCWWFGFLPISRPPIMGIRILKVFSFQYCPICISIQNCHPFIYFSVRVRHPETCHMLEIVETYMSHIWDHRDMLHAWDRTCICTDIFPYEILPQ